MGLVDKKGNNSENSWYQSNDKRTSISYQKRIVFLNMLQREEVLRSELLRKVRPKELKAILELCLNMKEGNLNMPTSSIITRLTNRNISLSNKKKWMLEHKNF